VKAAAPIAKVAAAALISLRMFHNPRPKPFAPLEEPFTDPGGNLLCKYGGSKLNRV
jgi:hypothetical protein